MASILYIPSENGLEMRFRALLGFAAPKKKLGICRTLGELSKRLRKPRSNVRVAVLFALSQEEIMGILSLGDLMADVKSLLILADDSRETIMKAHTLRPHYITWVDTDFRHIVSVFGKMIELYDVPLCSMTNHRYASSVKVSSYAMAKEGYRNL
jgi:hypothetical protein